MSPFTRRDFLKTSLAVGTVAGVGTLSLTAEARTATDKVTLGKSGVVVTRLAFGTGSNNGHVQSSLGQQEFSKLVAYAYERGIRFFETAESYTTPAMLGEALKPYPRDSYVLMNKVTTDTGVDPHTRFEDMLRTSKTDYFDIMLLHWQHDAEWPEETKRWQEGIDAAQAKKSHPLPRRVRSRPACPAADARQPVAASGDDPHESQGSPDGRSRIMRMATTQAMFLRWSSTSTRSRRTAWA